MRPATSVKERHIKIVFSDILIHECCNKSLKKNLKQIFYF